MGRHEIMPSIVHVQNSCLMTLNNILSASHTAWSPIVPDRRHSSPIITKPSSTPQTDVGMQPGSALQTVLANLRDKDLSIGQEALGSRDATELMEELRMRVDDAALSLTPDDAQLARALVSLITDFDRVHSMCSDDAELSAGFHHNPHETVDQPSSPGNVYSVLKRQLSSLQIKRQAKGDAVSPGSHPTLAVEGALLWSKIDDELEMVLSLCRQRTERLSRSSLESNRPPQYEIGDYNRGEALPEYEHGSRASIDSMKTKESQPLQINTTSTTSEKMRLDLEAVTMAIDRLYIAAPQLHNQRVELKSSKLAAMEDARRLGGRSAVSEGKQRERDFDHMMDLIGKASDRKMTDQLVVVEGGMGSRVEKARQRGLAKQEAFVDQLATHSKAGRLHGQDAVLDTSRLGDTERQRMTLPEFLLAESQKSLDSSSTRPETTPGLTASRTIAKSPSVSRLRKNSRSRSMSAPSFAWLRPSSAKSSAAAAKDEFKQMRASKSGSSMTSANATVLHSMLDVHYVAEHHENLNHVLAFLTIPNLSPGATAHARVLSPMLSSDDRSQIIIESGDRQSSSELDLPVRTSSRKVELQPQRGHYELKLPTTLDSRNQAASSDASPLYDATQLSASKPTSFICASCSLPLIQAAKISSYRDLPSEHWEELVDAWMCHADQSLHEQVAKRGRGFWPEVGQALVGGSYILFEESSVVRGNIHAAEQLKLWELSALLASGAKP
ncbi:hypothetical protein HWV62_35354 [Athelia sp. TMB]|nr:hypothetical protein HWV62_44677 [Athelia sp. TMB]KAF7968598.1 hypothetical protein HWV62_30049 [Athelia sp. TMB]KAF7986352.1 hypothetical protein HWV62_35354 [Athelia sp. TMB]